MKRALISLMAALIFIGGMVSFPSRAFADQTGTYTAAETEKVCNRWQDDFVVGNTVVFRARTKAGGLCPEERIAIINQRWTEIISEIQKTGRIEISSIEYDHRYNVAVTTVLGQPPDAYPAMMLFNENPMAPDYIQDALASWKKQNRYASTSMVFVNGRLLFTITGEEREINKNPIFLKSREWVPPKKVWDQTQKRSKTQPGRWITLLEPNGIWYWHNALLQGLVDMKLIPNDTPRPPYGT